MWCTNQTLLHKPTKTLWVIVEDDKEASESAWAWAWNLSSMVNEHGELKRFQNINEFTHVENEFGEPVAGVPQMKKRKIVGSDVSLYRYVKMSRNAKAHRRDETIKSKVEEYLNKLQNSKKDCVSIPISSYQYKYFWKEFRKHCDDFFKLKIDKFRYVQFIKIYNQIFRLDEHMVAVQKMKLTTTQKAEWARFSKMFGK